jgi:biopolymer transport protein ExbB/TolQ
MLIERLLKIALLGSEWVLYLLALLSMFSFTIMAERWIYFLRHGEDTDALRQKLVERMDAKDLEGAKKLVAGSRRISARIVSEALRWIGAGPNAISDAADSELARVKKDLEAGTNFLGTVGNNAPFVGLFGTVLGVIIAFEALGKTGQNAGAMGDVMAGIAEALVATGVGLFVALPSVVGYNVIQKRIGEIETDSIALVKLVMAYSRSGLSAKTDPDGASVLEAARDSSTGVEDAAAKPVVA